MPELSMSLCFLSHVNKNIIHSFIHVYARDDRGHTEGFDAADAFNVGQSWRWFHFSRGGILYIVGPCGPTMSIHSGGLQLQPSKMQANTHDCKAYSNCSLYRM